MIVYVCSYLGVLLRVSYSREESYSFSEDVCVYVCVLSAFKTEPLGTTIDIITYSHRYCTISMVLQCALSSSELSEEKFTITTLSRNNPRRDNHTIEPDNCTGM